VPTTTDLRRAPSARELAALRDAVLPGGRVGGVRRLRGGLSHGMHAVDLLGPDGARVGVVVRRYPDERLRERPDVAEREHAILSLLRDLDLPTPRPLWLDDGRIFGGAALVMTRLPGRPLRAPRDPAAFAAELGRALARVHAARLDEQDAGVLRADDWLGERMANDPPAEHLEGHPDGAPVWSALRDRWPRVVHGPTVLVHGDYWAGNTLWRRDHLVGVVDWDGCRRGHPGRDVGYCRMDLAMLLGPAAPDDFLAAYEGAAGRPFPDLAFWDLLGATIAMPDPERWLPGYHDLGRRDVTPELMQTRLRAFIADALSRAAGAAG
jgi:aminoglycoside phosphotransferase (APT) family kinase protein